MPVTSQLFSLIRDYNNEQGGIRENAGRPILPVNQTTSVVS